MNKKHRFQFKLSPTFALTIILVLREKHNVMCPFRVIIQQLTAGDVRSSKPARLNATWRAKTRSQPLASCRAKSSNIRGSNIRCPSSSPRLASIAKRRARDRPLAKRDREGCAASITSGRMDHRICKVMRSLHATSHVKHFAKIKNR